MGRTDYLKIGSPLFFYYIFRMNGIKKIWVDIANLASHLGVIGWRLPSADINGDGDLTLALYEVATHGSGV